MANFDPDMTVAAAMAVHPKVRDIFAGFHLGGCAHCAISEFETIRQICEGYGVPLDVLMDTMESFVNENPVTQEQPDGGDQGGSSPS